MHRANSVRHTDDSVADGSSFPGETGQNIKQAAEPNLSQPESAIGLDAEQQKRDHKREEQ